MKRVASTAIATWALGGRFQTPRQSATVMPLVKAPVVSTSTATRCVAISDGSIAAATASGSCMVKTRAPYDFSMKSK